MTQVRDNNRDQNSVKWLVFWFLKPGSREILSWMLLPIKLNHIKQEYFILQHKVQTLIGISLAFKIVLVPTDQNN